MTVPAHGNPAPTHFGLPGAPAPAAPIDYTGQQPAAPAMQPVEAADTYDAAAAAARQQAELAARGQLAGQREQQHHPDDRQGEAPGQVVADMQAEVYQETAATTVEPERSPTPEGAVEVTLTTRLGTDTIRVLHPDEWSSSANSALHVGEFESWAEACLADGDYEQVWIRLDPRLGDINEMFKEWRRVSGRDTGKSSRSPASLRRAARR
jgi:hypothetical protein